MPMKRIILSVMVMAFAVAVQAGDGKQCTEKQKAACAAAKTKVSKDEGTCPLAKSACCAKKQQEAKKDTAKQPVLLAPKAADTAK